MSSLLSTSRGYTFTAVFAAFAAAFASVSCSTPSSPPAATPEQPAAAEAPAPSEHGTEGALPTEPEVHLKDPVQLTFGGENAEAYWSFDGSKLIYQAHEG